MTYADDADYDNGNEKMCYNDCHRQTDYNRNLKKKKQKNLKSQKLLLLWLRWKIKKVRGWAKDGTNMAVCLRAVNDLYGTSFSEISPKQTHIKLEQKGNKKFLSVVSKNDKFCNFLSTTGLISGRRHLQKFRPNKLSVRKAYLIVAKNQDSREWAAWKFARVKCMVSFCGICHHICMLALRTGNQGSNPGHSINSKSQWCPMAVLIMPKSPKPISLGEKGKQGISDCLTSVISNTQILPT